MRDFDEDPITDSERQVREGFLKLELYPFNIEEYLSILHNKDNKYSVEELKTYRYFLEEHWLFNVKRIPEL